MDVPRDNEGKDLMRAVNGLRQVGRSHLDTLVAWIRRERDARDAENRVRGHENTTTEAEALTTLLDVLEKKEVANG